jgi:hypothetical protein
VYINTEKWLKVDKVNVRDNKYSKIVAGLLIFILNKITKVMGWLVNTMASITNLVFYCITQILIFAFIGIGFLFGVIKSVNLKVH